MTIRADVTVNWSVSPRIITVDSPSTEITIQDLYDTLMSLESQFDAIDEDHIIDAAGKEALGGGTTVGLTATLLNALLAFEARTGPTYTQCSVSGGNLVALQSDLETYFTTPISPTAFTQIVTTASSSATTASQEQLEYATYNNGVTVDVINGTAGTAYPIGTPGSPSNNMVDAHIIATDRGFANFFIKGTLTLTAGDFSDGHKFIGESVSTTYLILDDAPNVTNAEFFNICVTGILDQNNVARECLLNLITSFNGFMIECGFLNNITLGTGQTTMVNCYSNIAGAGTVTLDMGGAGASLANRGYTGGMTIINKTGTDEISIDLHSGHINLDSTITNGAITVRGLGKLTNSVTGTAIVDSADFISGSSISSIADDVWGKQINGVVSGSFGEVMKHHSFDNQVSVDVNNGAAGTTYPLGTPEYPVNNMADAVIIAATHNITTIHIEEDVTIFTGTILDGLTIQGSHAIKSDIIVQAGVSTDFTQFTNCNLTGTLDGWVVIRDSLVDALAGAQGIFHQVALSGTITLAGIQTSHFLSCYSSVVGYNTPEIDFGGSGRTAAMRDYNGGIKISNKTGAESISIDMNSGHIKLDGTITQGTIICRGVGKLTDTSQGTTIVDDQLTYSTANAVSAIFNEQIDQYVIAGSFGEYLNNKLLTVARYVGLRD